MEIDRQDKMILGFFAILGIGFIISALICSYIFPHGIIDWIFIFVGILCFLLDILIIQMIIRDKSKNHVLR